MFSNEEGLWGVGHEEQVSGGLGWRRVCRHLSSLSRGSRLVLGQAQLRERSYFLTQRYRLCARW